MRLDNVRSSALAQNRNKPLFWPIYVCCTAASASSRAFQRAQDRLQRTCGRYGPLRQLCGRDLRALAAPARCPEAALPARHSRQRRRHRRLDRASAGRPAAREGSSNRGSRKFAGNRRERGCERPEGVGAVAGGALNGTWRPQGGRAASPRPRGTQAALSRHPAGAKKLIFSGFARQRLKLKKLLQSD